MKKIFKNLNKKNTVIISIISFLIVAIACAVVFIEKPHNPDIVSQTSSSEHSNTLTSTVIDTTQEESSSESSLVTEITTIKEITTVKKKPIATTTTTTKAPFTTAPKSEDGMMTVPPDFYEELKTCEYCGKSTRFESNGNATVCVRYIVDTHCHYCGEWVTAFTCHYCPNPCPHCGRKITKNHYRILSEGEQGLTHCMYCDYGTPNTCHICPACS